MEQGNFEELYDEALLTGIAEFECILCGSAIQCEPHADSAWCDTCQKTVKVKNFLAQWR